MSSIPKAGHTILQDRYCLKGESVDALLTRASQAWATNDSMSERIRSYLDKGWLTMATPVLSNAPKRIKHDNHWKLNMILESNFMESTQRGLPISCFVSAMGDSRNDIFDTVTETGFASSLGGGLGISLEMLRPAGSPTSRGSASTGIIPFAQLEQSAVLATSQGDTRRGSVAFWLPMHHPEIHEFLAVRREHGGDPSRKLLHSHHGVILDDDFMQAVRQDDDYDLVDPNTGKVTSTEKARDLWFKLLEIRKETGEPMILNKSRVDEGIKELGLSPTDYSVIQSNLCVTGSTLILDSEGYVPIQDRVGEATQIWDGEQFSEVTPFSTGKQQCYLATFSNGISIECTGGHKFPVKHGYGKHYELTPLDDMEIGDKVEIFDMPVIPHDDDLPVDPYSQGFYSGDGNTGLNHSWLYSTKYCCESRLVGSFGKEHKSASRKTWKHGPMLRKNFVPFEVTVEDRLDWLAGLLDADGTVGTNGDNQSLLLASVDRDFLEQVQLMLTTLGVTATVALMRKAGTTDFGDGYGAYPSKDCYRLSISSVHTQALLSLGLNMERLSVVRRTPQRSALRKPVLISVEPTEVKETYCFTNKRNSLGTFNGMVTGQCSEILLQTSEDTGNVCCLSSLNLLHWDDYKDDHQFFRDVVELLDNAMEYFVHFAPEEMQSIVAGAIRDRPLGIGTLGFFSYLQKKDIAVSDLQAVTTTRSIYAKIKEETHKASAELAVERGVPESCTSLGRRNLTLTAVAQ